MKEEILVMKGQDNTYSENYVREVFDKSTDINLIKSVVEKAQDRIYLSWASVEARDKSNERIPIEDIIKNQKILMQRGAPIMDSHSNVHVGKTLGFKVMTHPKSNTLGVLHLNKIFNDSLKDNEVWNKIKSGEYTGSSVGGYSTDSEYETDKQGILKKLIGFTQFETSAVKEPCNPFALNESFSVVAKGMTEGEESFENKDYKKMVKKTKQEQDIKKETDVLNMIMSKISQGQELSPEEEKALSAAIDAAQSSMSEGASSEEDKATDEPMEEEEKPMEEEDKMDENPVIQKIMERLDMIEEQISGGTDKQEEAEDEDEDKYEKSEDNKVEKTDDEPVEEEVSEEEDNTEEIKKELEDTKKQLEEYKNKYDVVEVVESERPAVAKTNKNVEPNAGDVAMNRAKVNHETGKVEWLNKKQ